MVLFAHKIEKKRKENKEEKEKHCKIQHIGASRRKIHI